MCHVIVALLPAVVTSLYYFGLSAASVIVVAVAAAVVTEWAVTRFILRRPSSVGDLSAVVTGLLIALNVSSSLPLWTVAMGSFFAIAVAKMAFGGLGCNIFNPALVGRVFLLVSFPALMTVWPLPGSSFHGVADGATGPTVLSFINDLSADGQPFSVTGALLGEMGGSMGEVGAIAIMLGFVYLIAVRVITWHIPVAIIASTALFALVAGAPVVANVLSGGLLLGAVFMATDYVTSPMTRVGQLVYGALIGLITMLIRLYGDYPEGMSFAILLGNAVTPLINIYIVPRRFSPSRQS